MKTNKKLLAYLIVISIVLFTVPSLTIAKANWDPQFNLNGSIGNEDINGFVGQGVMTYPFKQKDDSLFYIDLRGMTNGNKVTEYNLGIGYKKYYEKKEYILGGYAFKDWRNEFDYTWKQWTIGAEYLSSLFDLRVNGYFPTKERVLLNSISSDQILVSGNNVIYEEADLNTFYKTMSGYDIEIGKKFTERFPIDLGVYLRAYNFSGENIETLSGMGLRINTNYKVSDKTDMQIGIDWQDDNVRGSTIEGTVGFTIPLGNNEVEENNKKDNLKNRMVEAPKRDINVIVGKTKPTKIIKDSGAAVDLETLDKIGNAWFVTKNGNGIGTKEDPANISDLIDSSENDLIIILGKDGEINTDNYSEVTSSLVLKSGQKIVSPSGSIYLKNEKGDRIAQYIPEGKQATLTNDISQNILEIADNTTVSGFNFKNGKNSIYGSEVAGKLRISNNIIENAAGSGIFIESEEIDSVVIDNNLIKSAGEEGIALRTTNILYEDIPRDDYDNILPILNQTEGNGKLNVTINNNEVQDVVNNGIVLAMYSDDESQLTFSDNIVKKANSGMEIWSYAAKDNNMDIIRNNVIEAEQNGINIYVNQPLDVLRGEFTPKSISLRNTNNYDNNILIVDNKIGKVMGGYGVGVTSISTGQNIIQMNGNIVDYLGSYNDEVHYRIMAEPGLSDRNTALYINSRSKFNNSVITIARNKVKYSGGNGITVNNSALGESNVNLIENEFNIIKGNGINSNIIADSNITKINNNIIENSSSGIYVDVRSTRKNVTSISDNVVEDTQTGVEVRHYDNDTNELSITNNKFSYNSSGIYVYSYNTKNDTIIDISNNFINSSLFSGFELHLCKENNSKLDIFNNNIKDSGRAMNLYLDRLNNFSEVNIYNNNIYDIDSSAINMNAYQTNNSNKVNIYNNNIYDIGSSAINMSLYQTYNFNKVNIYNNNIYDIGRSAIYMSAYQTNNSYINIYDNQMEKIFSNGVYFDSRGSQLYTDIYSNGIEVSGVGIYIKATGDEGAKGSVIDSNIYQNYFCGAVENEDTTGIKMKAIDKNADDGMGIIHIIKSTINSELNDNIFDDNINFEIVKEGEIVNLTGNQAP